MVPKRWRVYYFYCTLVSVLLLAGCADDPPTAADKPTGQPASNASVPAADAQAGAATGYTPVFEPDDCPFEVPTIGDYRCGYLIVPEDRSTPDGAQVELAVGIALSASATPQPDPIIYLEGGPGGTALSGMEIWHDLGYTADRDVIVFDQRGTGFSFPSLDCPEALDDAYDDMVSAALACHERLVSDGVNPAMYNSAASAADIADLRTALGYADTPVNILGISYGTRLALTLLRDSPDLIRSVVLDSVYPPNVDGYAEEARNIDLAFDRLFSGCAADPACAAAFPDLERRFYATLEDMQDAPRVLPSTGDEVDGEGLLDVVVLTMYDTFAIPELPLIIDAVANGDDEALEYLVFADGAAARLYRYQDEPDSDSEGMAYSVQCYEEFPFTADTNAPAFDGEMHPLVANQAKFLREIEGEVCAFWGAGTAIARENAAVSSDVPVLLLAGEYDPVTPPEWADVAAATLPNSNTLVFPGRGHGISLDGDCPTDVTLAFLADPAAPLATACMDAPGTPPAFVVP